VTERPVDGAVENEVGRELDRLRQVRNVHGHAVGEGGARRLGAPTVHRERDELEQHRWADHEQETCDDSVERESQARC